jgi:hypothetical protein
MGFSWLDGQTWSQVTRDERFFCQALYNHILAEGAGAFVRHLVADHRLQVDPGGEWEAAYEAVFYRDLWQHRGRQGPLYSPKRTFDLALFGEHAIVVIEAKAAQGFDPDQNRVFERDIAEIKRQTGVPVVHLVGLCSSKARLSPRTRSTFTGPVLRWADLAARYDDAPLLQRADDVYRPAPSRGRHATGKRTGAELLAAATGGATGWVGRTGGRHGAALQEDLDTGSWRTRTYEFNKAAETAPNRNWFSLAEFAAAVAAPGATV